MNVKKFENYVSDSFFENEDLWYIDLLTNGIDVNCFDIEIVYYSKKLTKMFNRRNTEYRIVFFSNPNNNTYGVYFFFNKEIKNANLPRGLNKLYNSKNVVIKNVTSGKRETIKDLAKKDNLDIIDIDDIEIRLSSMTYNL